VRGNEGGKVCERNAYVLCRNCKKREKNEREHVRTGAPLSHPLSHCTIFPKPCVQLQCSMPIWATMAIWAKLKFDTQGPVFGLGIFSSSIHYILLICNQNFKGCKLVDQVPESYQCRKCKRMKFVHAIYNKYEVLCNKLSSSIIVTSIAVIYKCSLGV
jgi:hypothetical protein